MLKSIAYALVKNPNYQIDRELNPILANCHFLGVYLITI